MRELLWLWHGFVHILQSTVAILDTIILTWKMWW